MKIYLDQIRRYPIKGFSGESITDINIPPQGTLPGDRQFAVKYVNRQPPSNCDWLPKTFFMQSVRTDICSSVPLKWHKDIFETPNGDSFTRSLAGISKFTKWIAAAYPALDPIEAYRSNKPLTDEDTQLISLINMATVKAISEATNTKNSGARYRGNLYIHGEKEFAEMDWIGRNIRIGTSICRVIAPIERCFAIECDWQGLRNKGLLAKVDQAFNTICCGIFLTVERGGTISVNNALEFID